MIKAASNTQVAGIQSTTELQTIIELTRRPDGASLNELMPATSWQEHSVRGALSGALKKKDNIQISSTVVEGRGRVYRIQMPTSDHPTTSTPVSNNEVQS